MSYFGFLPLPPSFQFNIKCFPLTHGILPQNKIRLRFQTHSISASFFFKRTPPGNQNMIQASGLEVQASDEDSFYMYAALKQAELAFLEGEVPVGAVIVKDGKIIASTRNQVEAHFDPTSHSEILCIKEACKILKNWRLLHTVIYCTLEPCPMCLAAIQAARIKKLVYGAPDLRLGAVDSWIQHLENKHPFHKIEYVRGVLAEESSSLMKRFFKMRREGVNAATK